MRLGGRNLTVLVAAIAAVLAAVPASAMSLPEATAACSRNADLESKVTACSFVIEHAHDRRALLRAHNTRGLALCDLDRCPEAISDFDRVIAIEPSIAGYFDNRARALRAAKRIEEAIADSDRAIRMAPGYAFTYMGKAFSLDAGGRYEEAVREIDKAITVDAKNAWHWEFRGEILGKLGRYSEAETSFEKSLSLEPSRPGVFKARAEMETARGNLDAALTDYARYPADGEEAQAVKEAVDALRARIEAKRDAERQAARIPTGSPAGPAVAPATPSVSGQKRVALLIGNSTYRSVPYLPNPNNDARSVAASLRALGFQTVRLAPDLSREAFVQALRDFRDEADTADWAIVYYAGHGIEVNGMNYMIPVDARLASDRDIEDEAVSLDRVLATISSAKALKVVILDACRNNPFLGSMRRSIASRSIHRGLAQIEPEGSTLVVYAAKAGETADDGQGGHSPFSSALIRRLDQPHVEIRRLFDLVTGDVLKATGGRQRPFTYGSIPGEEDFYFKAER